MNQPNIHAKMVAVTNIVHSGPQVPEPTRTVLDWIVQRAVSAGLNVSVTTVPVFTERIAVIDLARAKQLDDPSTQDSGPHGIGTELWAGLILRPTGAEVLSEDEEISREIATWIGEAMGAMGEEIRVSNAHEMWDEAAPVSAQTEGEAL